MYVKKCNIKINFNIFQCNQFYDEQKKKLYDTFEQQQQKK